MSGKRWLSFNTNYYVRVRLSELGRKRFREHALEMRQLYPQMPELWPLEPRLDTEGYFRDQLWHVMALFGSVSGAGGSPFIGCEIQFDAAEVRAAEAPPHGQ